MVLAVLESVKYVGHFFPLILLRLYIGYLYLSYALTVYQGNFLSDPQIAQQSTQALSTNLAPLWYQSFLTNWAIPNWKIFAVVMLIIGTLIGLSLIIGYLVRPISLLAILFCLNMLWIMGPDAAILYQVLIVVHITLGWLGAGRCLGLDYFFFKRQRGLWW